MAAKLLHSKFTTERHSTKKINGRLKSCNVKKRVCREKLYFKKAKGKHTMKSILPLLLATGSVLCLDPYDIQ